MALIEETVITHLSDPWLSAVFQENELCSLALLSFSRVSLLFLTNYCHHNALKLKVSFYSQDQLSFMNWPFLLIPRFEHHLWLLFCSHWLSVVLILWASMLIVFESWCPFISAKPGITCSSIPLCKCVVTENCIHIVQNISILHRSIRLIVLFSY